MHKERVYWCQDAQAEAAELQETKPENQAPTASLKRVKQPLEGDYWGFAYLDSEWHSIIDPKMTGIGGEIK